MQAKIELKRCEGKPEAGKIANEMTKVSYNELPIRSNNALVAFIPSGSESLPPSYSIPI
jgi:hypothetical protein